MRKEYIVEGKTLEEAKATAYAEHGNEGELTFTVLRDAKKGFLGIGSATAQIKVEVFYDERQDAVDSILRDVRKLKTFAGKGSGRPSSGRPDGDRDSGRGRGDRRDENRPPRRENENRGENRTENAPRAEEGSNAKSRNRRRRKKKPASQTEGRSEANVRASVEKPVVEERQKVEVTDAELDAAAEFTANLLGAMGLEAHAEFDLDENGKRLPRMNILGDEGGVLIGHHGETLDAIQYLVNLSVNRKAGEGKEFVKIAVDVENYRFKREETLRALARRMADKCLRTRRNVVLEPMNPYERRIIHSEIQGIENVSTHSVGYDENRKIVVTYEGPGKPAERGSGKGNRRGGNQEKKPERGRSAQTEEALEALKAYEAEKAENAQAKPEKMTFEDFAASDSTEMPMSILSEKKNTEEK